MKLRPMMSYAMAAAMALGLFCFGPGPAAAEEDMGGQQRVTDWGPLRYRVFQYPSKSTGFFFFPESYVTFDVVNGKYWTVESGRVEYEVLQDPFWTMGQVFPWAYTLNTIRPELIDVTFYTPDMKVLGSFKRVRANHTYSIPRDGNDYERIICRIEHHAGVNHDLKMRVWDAVEPVMAEPIGGARSRP